MDRNQIPEVSPISELVPVDPKQVFPVWHKSDVTTSLAAPLHLVPVRGKLLICGAQVHQGLLEHLRW